MPSTNPYDIVIMLEERLADWCGSKYAIAVESASAGIFLSLQYRKFMRGSDGLGVVDCPKLTYPSTPCSIIHSGGKVSFKDIDWEGEHEIGRLDVWDAALRLKRNMYHGGLQIISMHVKKHLNVGRGGCILTDDIHARDWLRKARFDGRSPVPLQEDNFTMLGWNAYLEPSQAARAIQLFEIYRSRYPDGAEDLKVSEQKYADLSKFAVYQ